MRSRRPIAVAAVLAAVTAGGFALRGRTTRKAPAPVASSTVAPPLAEPSALVRAKTTPKTPELQRGALEVAGLVKDISGGPIPNATITVTMQREGSKIGSVATSDEKGEFRAFVDEGEIVAEATADGYSDGTWYGIAPGQRVELVLTPESVLQGRVVEAGTDRPIAGALVTADAEDGDVSSKAVSDAEGRFRIRRLGPGHYKPEAVTPNRWGTARASVLLGLAETVSDVVIEVHPSLSVVGRVLRGDEGCAGAHVTLADGAQDLERDGTADEHGEVHVEGLFAGTYEVSVDCADSRVATPFPPIVVKDEDVRGVVWKADVGFTIRGTLLDDRGDPVGDGQVTAQRDGDTSSADTNADGTFAIHALAGGSYELVVMRDGISSSDEAPTTVRVDHDVDGVRVVMKAGGTVRGSVVDDVGAPVSGVQIAVKPDALYGQAVSMTRDDGTFEVHGLHPGLYEVTALRGQRELRAPGATEHDQLGKSVVVAARGTSVVKLVVEGEHGVVRGRVLDGAGQPLGDVFVEAERQGDDASTARGKRFDRTDFGSRDPIVVDPEGRFTIGELAAGTYAVRAFRKGGGDAIAQDVALGSDVTLVIRDEAALSGTVAGAKDRFFVTLHEPSGTLQRVESFFRTDGAFVIRDVPEGTYDVLVESPEGRRVTQVTLSPGQKRDDLQLVLEPFGRICGRVVGVRGRPFIGYVRVVPVEARWPDTTMFTYTDPLGRFDLPRVPAGRLWLRAYGEEEDVGPSESEQTIVVEPGRTLDVPPLQLTPHVRD